MRHHGLMQQISLYFSIKNIKSSPYAPKTLIFIKKNKGEKIVRVCVTIGAWASAGLVVLDLQGGALEALDGPLLQQMLFAIHGLGQKLPFYIKNSTFPQRKVI